MYMEDLLTVSVVIDNDGIDKPVLQVTRTDHDGSLNIIKMLTGKEAIDIYNKLTNKNVSYALVTYGDIYNQFLESTQTDISKVEDWRPCGPPYYDTHIDMAIIIWLKDGSQLIYIYKKEKE